MKKETQVLLKGVLKNSLIAILIFSIVLVFLFLVGLKDNIKGIAIASGIVGSAYILTIRNPNNYFGFYLGILSSILLGIQFYLIDNFELFFVYFFIFIPSQAISIYTWKKGNKQDGLSYELNPSFLSFRNFLIVTACFLLLFIADIFIAREVSHAPQVSLSIQIFSAIFVAASILANILLIKKKTDSWYYWFIFSIAGIILNILYKDYVTVTLFVIYLLINSEAGLMWIKKTPKENYGWLKGK
jgi:nicotinamide mononucleotide transporter PnuC